MLHHKVDAATARGLIELRRRIKVPAPILDETINIATWNIREFGKKRRCNASISYIAEIMSHFDLVAVTEVRENTGDLERVMSILGPYWRAIYSDTIMDSGGNRERIAYVYDSRVMRFTGLAAEADPIRKKNRKTGEYESSMSWWRSPYLASFRAGRFDFVLLTAHIRWGRRAEDRRQALERFAEWIEARRRLRGARGRDMIVMGDFNIPKVGDPLYRAITSKGLVAPRQVMGVRGTNLGQTKHFDQILYYPEHARSVRAGGVVDFYGGDFSKLYPPRLYPGMTKRKFTYQMSDHLPLWVQLDVWSEDDDLEQMAGSRQ